MVEVNGLKLSAGQLRYLFLRTFWKQTRDANLNYDEGCRQAATVAARFIQELNTEWKISHIPEIPEFILDGEVV
jgi:hypothetical protein